MNRLYWLPLSLGAAFAILSGACSSQFSSCEARRSCPAGGSAGASAREAGSGGEAGDERGDRSEGGGSGEEGGSGGEGGELGLRPVLFDACSQLGQSACSGIAMAQRLACDGSKWLAGTTCAAGELCDSMSGECAKVVPECLGSASGNVVCRGDKLLSCGVDLVSALEGETCAGGCEDGVCRKQPICGDQKVELGEECDDGKNTAGGCGPDCKAICGDKKVLAGYEECDDGNVLPGDGCGTDCNWEPIALSLGDTGTCALSQGGTVKCWGDNSYGQLGQGDTRPRGGKPGELAELPAIQLGTGRTVKAISSGRGTNCALLDNGRVKCWGFNGNGQLGLGHFSNRGDRPEQMGDKLPSITLVGNLTATSISNGYLHACAVANDAVQCWGSGVSGQLGQGDTDAHVEPVGVFDFGKVASVSASSGGAFTCQLLQTGSVICWGDNRAGQLSYSQDLEFASVGDSPNEMSGLFGLAFPGLTAKSVALGIASGCALLSDNSVRCWGRGDSGQLGTEDPDPHGMVPYSLVTVGPVALGSGRTPKAITSGARHVCVLLDDASVKCWGDNSYGQLGIGSTATVVGASPGTMGDNLRTVLLGAGRKARQVVAGENHSCALLDNSTITCWGRNSDGQLGLGDTVNHDAAGEGLPAVPLSF